ncbi:hypothetical protein LBMAG49_07060 [Planctomycetota bacterium]|nr:hypothetical protein LBMAG49_07060 [Planctomycetota bacterium]
MYAGRRLGNGYAAAHHAVAAVRALPAIWRLAFGGPIAQIGMLRTELVERERWASPQHFLRALAVYQALLGPRHTNSAAGLACSRAAAAAHCLRVWGSCCRASA